MIESFYVFFLSFCAILSFQVHPKLPSLKRLEAEREQLISEKARFYEAYREAKKAWIELSTAQKNLLSTLHREDRQQEAEQGGLHDLDRR